MKITRQLLLSVEIIVLCAGIGLGLASCSHAQTLTDTLKTCGSTEVKNAVAKIGPDVTAALECEAGNTENLPACTKTALANIAKRAGDDVLTCAVAAYPEFQTIADVLGKAEVTPLQTLGKKRQQAWLKDRANKS